MTTFVVTTPEDTVADDGLLSLREAINAAGSLTGQVTITFAPEAFVTDDPLPTPIQLESRLNIDTGAALTIDGSLVQPGYLYNVQIQPSTGGDHILTVEAGSTVTLRDVFLSGGTAANPIIGSDGLDGARGATGARGENGQGLGAAGTDAEDGARGEDGTPGAMAVGGIVNNGALTLERVQFQSIGAEGGDGGRGGDGGAGGMGGWGGTIPTMTLQQTAIRGDGGDGGNGARGGDGGSGGLAVGAILNNGTLTMRDVGFSNLLARGGAGGDGGAGGNGGHGGAYAGSNYLSWNEAGGAGGNGGNGGDGGDGGRAAAALWSAGSVEFDGPQSAPVSLLTADGGRSGAGGDVGIRGAGGVGYYLVNFTSRTPADGPDGASGTTPGADGQAGGGDAFFGASPALSTVFSLAHTGETETDVGDTQARTIMLSVAKLGDGAGAVSWRVVPGHGITPDDFEGGELPSGRVEFTPGGTLRFIFITMAEDGVAEGPEDFTVELFDAQGGVPGWSDSVSITVDDGGHGAQRTITLVLRGVDDLPIAGARATFTPDGGTSDAFELGDDGLVVFSLVAREAGLLTLTHDYVPARDGAVTPNDALEVLRMAVGLDPSFGPASPQNWIAADIDGNGRVDASDALEILRAAVGLESANAPRWVFVDAAPGGDSVLQDGQPAPGEGLQIAGDSGSLDLAMTGILLGSLVDLT